MRKHFISELILSGNNLEVTEFDNIKYFGYKKTTPKVTTRNTPSLEEKEAINKKTTTRAIKEVKRLLACNYYTDNRTAKFLTFTFNVNVSKIQSKDRLKLFHKRLKRNYGYIAKYVGVSELQQNGNIHLHLVYFGLPIISHEILQNFWSYGSVNVKKIYNSDNSFRNITKYLFKDKDKNNNSNRYFTSKNNLKRPIIVRNDLVYEKVKHLLKDCYMDYIYTGENEFLGAYTKKSLDLSKLSPYEKKSIETILLNSF
ncbi:rolling circle replication-associated protein [Clostridium ihumii]|uniref:rolling circle replication-associated protein n=1 Tax=Clostridium ihumii TaxID=1470356 RepID=UPI00058BEB97|nr:hypothetical protein [Clostridium ihumii]